MKGLYNSHHHFIKHSTRPTFRLK